MPNLPPDASTVELGGGKERIEVQHASGKLTARERIEKLVDRESFEEIGLFAEHRATFFGMAGRALPADGVVTGCAAIDGRQVHLASQDFTVAGGAAGETHSDKIVEMMNMSLKTGSPFIFINDSGGARVQEGIDSLAGYARVFYHNVLLSGSVPQISLICGPCAGGAAYSPALTDFIIQTRQARMFITGPQVLKQVTGEEVTAEELGGAQSQMNYSGVVHLIAENDEEAIRLCRRLLSFLPSNNLEDPPRLPFNGRLQADAEMNGIVPADAKVAYDVRDVIARVVDHGDFLEIQPGFAAEYRDRIWTACGPAGGNYRQPAERVAGVLDINASDKAARFVRFCNAFNIPLMTFVDVPGFLPGVEQERGGIIRHGAKLLFAYSAATVPKITVVLRKAYGGAYIAMCSQGSGRGPGVGVADGGDCGDGRRGRGGDRLPREIDAAEDKAARRKEMVDEYRETFSNPYVAAGRRLVDEVIEPAETRRCLARGAGVAAHQARNASSKETWIDSTIGWW